MTVMFDLSDDFLVDLPSFLLEMTAQEMVARFQKHLYDQLIVFFQMDQSVSAVFLPAIKHYFRISSYVLIRVFHTLHNRPSLLWCYNVTEKQQQHWQQHKQYQRPQSQ